MSAAIARRRKQLAAKAKLASEGGEDPITDKMNTLLSPANGTISEETAYEALQLAQSQVRKSVKSGDYAKASVTYGYDVCMQLLDKHLKASVGSQLLHQLAQVLAETHSVCDEAWIERIQNLDAAYLKAVPSAESKAEQKRLYRLHSKFLKSVIAWSEVLGTVTYGALELHVLAANHAWFLSENGADDDGNDDDDGAASNGNGPSKGSNKKSNNKNNKDNKEDEDAEDFTTVALQSAAVTHYALAEKPDLILSKLATLPPPTAAQTKNNHSCAPAPREALLTRSILVMLTMENIRDATTLLTQYIDTIEERKLETLKKSYMAKGDGKSVNHVVFNSMLLSIVRKDKKTGPLYTWLLKGFTGAELATMYKSDMLKGYTSKIGRIFFDIQPPPSMMATLENMMGMMGGGGMGGGPGGMPGMNPAMMQAMMGGMGGGM